MCPFRDAFTAPTWRYVMVLVMGTILVPGRRTVASALRVTGLDQIPHFTNDHRVPNRNKWSARRLPPPPVQSARRGLRAERGAGRDRTGRHHRAAIGSRDQKARHLPRSGTLLCLARRHLCEGPSGRRIVSVAVIIAVGVNSDGRREVLGMAIGASEAETFWTEFLRTLARRGLRGVKLVISDAHEGLKAAVAKVLNVTWQRCRVHTMRNLPAHAGRQRRGVAAGCGLHRHRLHTGGCCGGHGAVAT